MAHPHPLDTLTIDEIKLARQLVLDDHPAALLRFREIFLHEPAKSELKLFLNLEHTGQLKPTSPRPARHAMCMYDVIGASRIPEYHESVVNLDKNTVFSQEHVDVKHHAPLTL